MSDMLDINDPTICTYCHQKPRMENSAVCESCGRQIEAMATLKAETFSMAKVLQMNYQDKDHIHKLAGETQLEDYCIGCGKKKSEF
jgi:hypothetical protein